MDLSDLMSRSSSVATLVNLPDPGAITLDRALSRPDVVGDLDGDSLADLLLMEQTPRYEEDPDPRSLTAVRGTDGSDLWSIDLSSTAAATYYKVGDRTDDGHQDLLLVTLVSDVAVSLGCDVSPLACLPKGLRSFRWEVALIDGASGAVRWDRAYVGAGLDGGIGVSTPVGIAGRAVTINAGLLVPIVNEQGLTINVIDLVYSIGVEAVYAPLGAAYEYNFATVARTRAEALGHDGTTYFRKTSDLGTGVSMLQPAGTTPAGTPLLLWRTENLLLPPYACVEMVVHTCRGDATHVDIVEGLDGSTGASLWSRSSDDLGEYMHNAGSVGGDVTGDNGDDVWIQVNMGDSTRRVHVVDGATGQVRVSVEGEASLVQRVADIELDGHFDVTIATRSWGRATVERVSAVSGTTLSRDVVNPYHDYYPTIRLGADLDADGAGDVFLLGGGIRVLSSRSPAVLLSANMNGRLAGDLDGDGWPDSVGAGWEYDEDFQPKWFVTAYGLPNNERRWRRYLDTDRSDGVEPFPVDDLNGGGDDVIVTIDQWRESGSRSRLEALDGRTGEVIWVRGEILPGDSDPVMASIEGTVTRPNGEPYIENLPVGLFDERGLWIYQTYTSYDSGMYRFNGVPPGTYFVRFGEMKTGLPAIDDADPTGPHEWFDDVATFLEAQPIEVTDQPITGIDATV